MFNLNPLDLPGAAWQHGLMLLVAGVLGFLIGYSSRQRETQQLGEELAGAGPDADPLRRRATPSANFDADGDETAVLIRVAARADQLNFDRIGRATAAQADDLKAIVGVGPFLEKKLNAVGIYTFRQVANLTPEDVEQVNTLIEFFPGRIARDNWVGQAAERLKPN